MREAPINRRADVVLFRWQIRSADGNTVAVGKDKAGQELRSANVEFLDSEQQLLLDANGVAWLIPADSEYVQDFVDVTEQYVHLIRQPRHQRTVRPLSEASLALLQKLTSKKHV
jgi:hypothetical protein